MSRSVPASLRVVFLLLSASAGAQPAGFQGHDAGLRFLLTEVIERLDELKSPSFVDLRHPANPGTSRRSAAASLQPGDASEQRSMVEPELLTVGTPLGGWDLYLQTGGELLRSNPRGGLPRDGTPARPKLWGTEAGARLSLFDGGVELVTVFRFVQLRSDPVPVFDAEPTERSDFTDPYGLDLDVRLRILPWMWAVTGLSFTPGNPVDVRAMLALDF